MNDYIVLSIMKYPEQVESWFVEFLPAMVKAFLLLNSEFQQSNVNIPIFHIHMMMTNLKSFISSSVAIRTVKECIEYVMRMRMIINYEDEHGQ